MAAAPRVSVLLPARDAAETVGAAAASLLDGSFGDLEIVAVDDGSRDATRRRLEQLARRDRRVRVVATEGLGIAGAIEAARREARGELLARQDADDRSAPRRLERQVRLLDHDPTLVGVGCGFRWEPEALATAGMRRYQEWQNRLVDPEAIRAAALIECPVTHATLVLRREAVAAAGGWRDGPWAEDYDLVLRLLLVEGRRLGKVGEQLYAWRERPGRLTRTHPAYRVEAFHRARVCYLTRCLLAPGQAVELWGTGKLLERWRTSLTAAGHEVRAVALNPRRLRAGFRHIPPERLPEPSATPLLVALGTPASRELFARALAARGSVGGRDHWMLG